MYIKKKRGHNIDPCGAPKMAKQNEIKRCNRLTLSLF